MKRIGKGREWEITDKDGITWNYKAVTGMEPFQFSRPTRSEYDEGPYLCWNHQRYYLSESYGAGVGVRLGDNNEEGQLIYFYVS